MAWSEWALTSPGLGEGLQPVNSTRSRRLEPRKPTRLGGASTTYMLRTMSTDDMAIRGRGTAQTYHVHAVTHRLRAVQKSLSGAANYMRKNWRVVYQFPNNSSANPLTLICLNVQALISSELMSLAPTLL